jgi:PilZ domain
MDIENSPSSQPVSPSLREAPQEARKFRRIPVDFPCLFSAEGPHEWSGTTVNLSREGCAIRSTTPVQKDQDLCVLLFLSANQAPIEVRVAPVRWSANDQFGVEFITLTPRDANRLQDLLTIISA